MTKTVDLSNITQAIEYFIKHPHRGNLNKLSGTAARRNYAWNCTLIDIYNTEVNKSCRACPFNNGYDRCLLVGSVLNIPPTITLADALVKAIELLEHIKLYQTTGQKI